LVPVRDGCGEEGLGTQGGVRQHRLEAGGQHAKQIQALAAHRLQLGVGAVLFGDHPGLLVVDVAIGLVGQGHQLANCAAVFALGIAGAHLGQGGDKVRVLRRLGQRLRQLAFETLGDEPGTAAGDVDELADQIGIDPLHEVF